MKQHVITGDSKLGTFFCGLCAGAMEATWVVTPMETIKVKLIHDKFKEKPQYRNLFQGIYTIVRQEGFGGIYKGNK
jgi:solute carrier family 25 (mitochondrial citrate transporter), member 1